MESCQMLPQRVAARTEGRGIAMQEPVAEEKQAIFGASFTELQTATWSALKRRRIVRKLVWWLVKRSMPLTMFERHTELQDAWNDAVGGAAGGTFAGARVGARVVY